MNLAKHRESVQKWKRNNSSVNASHSMKHRMREYGIKLSQYNWLLILQDGRCAICYKRFCGREPHIDHDHKTGKIRGLLCLKRNSGLGMFLDDKALVTRAMEYL